MGLVSLLVWSLLAHGSGSCDGDHFMLVDGPCRSVARRILKQWVKSRPRFRSVVLEWRFTALWNSAWERRFFISVIKLRLLPVSVGLGIYNTANILMELRKQGARNFLVSAGV